LEVNFHTYIVSSIENCVHIHGTGPDLQTGHRAILITPVPQFRKGQDLSIWQGPSQFLNGLNQPLMADSNFLISYLLVLDYNQYFPFECALGAWSIVLSVITDGVIFHN